MEQSVLVFALLTFALIALLPGVVEILNAKEEKLMGFSRNSLKNLAKINSKASKNKLRKAKKALAPSTSIYSELRESIPEIDALIKSYADFYGKEISTVIKYMNNAYSQKGLESVISSLSLFSEFKTMNYALLPSYFAEWSENCIMKDFLANLTKSKPMVSTEHVIGSTHNFSVVNYPIADFFNKYSSDQIEKHQYQYVDYSHPILSPSSKPFTELDVIQKARIMKRFLRLYPFTSHNSVNEPLRDFESIVKVEMLSSNTYKNFVSESICVDYLNGLNVKIPSYVDPTNPTNLEHSSIKNGISFSRDGNALLNATLSANPDFLASLCVQDYIAYQQRQLLAQRKHFSSIREVGKELMYETIPNTQEYTCSYLGNINSRSRKLIRKNREILKQYGLETLKICEYAGFAKNLFFGIENGNRFRNVVFEQPSNLIEKLNIADYVQDYDCNVEKKLIVCAPLSLLHYIPNSIRVIRKMKLGMKLPKEIAEFQKVNAKELFATKVSSTQLENYYKFTIIAPIAQIKKVPEVKILSKLPSITTFDREGSDSFMNSVNPDYRVVDRKERSDLQAQYGYLFDLAQFKKNVVELSEKQLQQEAYNETLIGDLAQYKDSRELHNAILKRIGSAKEIIAESKLTNQIAKVKGDQTQKDDMIRAFNRFNQTLNDVCNYRLSVEKSSDMKKISYIKIKNGRKDGLGRRSDLLAQNWQFYYDSVETNCLQSRSLIRLDDKLGRPQRGSSNRMLAISIAKEISNDECLHTLAQKVSTELKDPNNSIEYDSIKEEFKAFMQISLAQKALNLITLEPEEFDVLIEYGLAHNIISKTFSYFALKLPANNETKLGMVRHLLDNAKIEELSWDNFNSQSDIFCIKEIERDLTEKEIRIREKVHISCEQSDKDKETLKAKKEVETYLYISIAKSNEDNINAIVELLSKSDKEQRIEYIMNILNVSSKTECFNHIASILNANSDKEAIQQIANLLNVKSKKLDTIAILLKAQKLFDVEIVQKPTNFVQPFFNFKPTWFEHVLDLTLNGKANKNWCFKQFAKMFYAKLPINPTFKEQIALCKKAPNGNAIWVEGNSKAQKAEYIYNWNIPFMLQNAIKANPQKSALLNYYFNKFKFNRAIANYLVLVLSENNKLAVEKQLREVGSNEKLYTIDPFNFINNHFNSNQSMRESYELKQYLKGVEQTEEDKQKLIVYNPVYSNNSKFIGKVKDFNIEALNINNHTRFNRDLLIKALN